METKTGGYFTKKRLCAILMVLIMIIQLFSPYSVLTKNTYAQVPDGISEGEPYYVLKIRPIDSEDTSEDDWELDETSYYYYDYVTTGEAESIEESTEHVIFIDLIIRGSDKVNAGDINLIYDSTKLIPVHESYSGTGKKKTYFLEDANEFENPGSKVMNDFGTVNWGNPIPNNGLNKEKSSIRIGGANSGAGYIDEDTVVATLMFKLAEGVTINNIPKSTFRLEPDAGLEKGLEIDYYPSGSVQVRARDEKYLTYEGFADEEKTISSISVVDEMTKNKYYDTEELDFSGATIKISYSNNETEQMSLTEAIAKKIVKVDQTNAEAGQANSKVTISAVADAGVTTELDYLVITSIEFNPDPDISTEKYEQGDNIIFSGKNIDLVYDDGTTIDKKDLQVGLDDGTFTADIQTADVDHTKITITYKDGILSDQFNIQVYDPITEMVMSKTPTDCEYDHDQTIDTTGGQVRITRKSGKVEFVELNDGKISISDTKADINKCTDKQSVAGKGEVGTQTITVTYTEPGKDGTDVKVTTTYTILVNDTIASIRVSNQTTAKNKYGTELTHLNLEGAELTVTTQSGQTFNIPVVVGMLNPSEYTANSLAQQKLTVTYAGQTTDNDTDKLVIELKNYVTGIQINNTGDSTEFYATKLENAGFISEITYIEQYADGSHANSGTPITKEMIQGYNDSPSAEKFDSSHLCNETLTLTVTDVDEFNTVVSTTFDIKIKDVVTGIKIDQRPSKTVYNYGDTFDPAGGRIKFHYASGAEDTTFGILMTASEVTVSYNDLTATKAEVLKPLASEFENGTCKKTLLVTYHNEEGSDITGYTDSSGMHQATFDITIKDVVKSVKVTGGTPASDVEYGEEYNPGDGLTIEVTYESGATKNVGVEDIEVIDDSTDEEFSTSPETSEFTDGTNKVTKQVKFKYEENGKTVETDAYDVDIKDTVASMTVKDLPDQNYNLNASSWNLTGAKLEITRKSGRQENIDLDASDLAAKHVTITDASTVTNEPGDGKQVTVTYTDPLDSEQHTTTFDVNVKDGVVGVDIEVDTSSLKKKYNYGEELNFTGLDIYVKYASTVPGTKGTHKAVDVTMVKDVTEVSDGSWDLGTEATTSLAKEKFTPTYNIKRKLKVKYSIDGYEKEYEYEIEIYNIVDSIKIDPSDEPQKSYEVGESIPSDNGAILVHRKAGNEEKVDMEDSRVKVTDLETTTAQTGKTATVTYTEKDATDADVTKQVTYQYDVIDQFKSVAIEDAPIKTAYNWGDTLDLKGLVFKKIYSSQTLTYANDDINTIKSDIQIKEVKGSDEVAFAELLEPDKSEFATTDTVTKHLKVIYTVDGKTDSKTFDITIKDNMKSISINTMPDKVEYNLNEQTWDLTATSNLPTQKADIKVIYQSGKEEIVELTEAMLTPLKDLTTAVNNSVEVEVKYGQDKDGQDLKTTFNIKVVDGVVSVSIDTTNFTNKEYNYGEDDSLDFSPITITVQYASNRSETIDITQADIKDITDDPQGEKVTTKLAVEDFKTDNIAERQIQIKYTADGSTISDTKTVTIKVHNIVDHIEIDPDHQPKTDYEIGDDPSDPGPGGKIRVYRKADLNTYETVDITYDMVSGLATAAAGASKTATVTYESTGAYGAENNKTVDYYYNVNDALHSVDITGDPKKEYNWGDKLDLTGLTFTNRFASADQTITNIDDVEQYLTLDLDGDSVDVDEILQPDKDDFSNVDGKYKVTKHLKVTYEYQDKSIYKEFDIVITDNMARIDMNNMPDKLEYNLHEQNWNLTSTTNHENQRADIKVTYQSGREEIVELDTSMLTPLGDLTAVKGDNVKVEVKYGKDKDEQDLKTEFNIKVVDGITSITIDTSAFEDEYNYGDTVDLSQIKIKIQRASGEQTEIPATSAMVKDTTSGSEDVKTELDSTAFISDHKAERTLTITYTLADGDNYTGDTTTTTQITVYDIVDHIEIDPTNKPQENYSIGADTNNPGGQIRIYRKSNPSVFETESITSGMVTGLETTSAGAHKTATVTYHSTGANGVANDKTVDYYYNVNDTLNGVQITGTPKTQYNWGDQLDLTGLTFTNQFASGDQNITNVGTISSYITVEIDSVSATVNETLQPAQGEFSLTSGKYQVTKRLKVTYTYQSKTDSKEFDIVITDNMASIAMKTEPDKKTYNVNEAAWVLDAVGATHNVAEIEVTYQSGRTELVDIQNDMLPVLTTLTGNTGSKQVTVTYGMDKDSTPLTTEFTITVENGIVNQEITGEIAEENTKYNYGDDLKLGGLKLKTQYADGTDNEVDLDLDDPKLKVEEVVNSGVGPETTQELTRPLQPNANEFGPDDEVKKKVRVTYEKEDGTEVTEEFDITIKNNKVSIQMHTYPEDLKYNIGEATYKLTAASGTGTNGNADIEVTYQAGNTKIVEIDSSMLTTLTTLTTSAGAKQVTVTYGTDKDSTPLTTEFTITVQNGIVNQEITGTINPENTEYDYGDDLELGGLKLKTEYADGTQDEKDLDITDPKITIEEVVTDGSGSETTKPLTRPLQPSADEFDANDEVKKKVKVTYEKEDGSKETEEFDITIKNNKVSIQMNTYPDDLKYDISETQYKLDAALGTNGKADIKVIYQAGNHKLVALNDPAVQLTNLTDLTTSTGTKRVNVTYGADKNGTPLTTYFEITVVDGVEKIELSPAPTKQTYKYGDPLSVEGGFLKVTKLNGQVVMVPIQEDMIDGFDSELGTSVNYPYTQTLTVTYGNYENGNPATVTYQITIEDYVKDILLTPPTNTAYQYGVTELDLTGGSVQAIMASGKVGDTVLLTDGSVQLSAFDKEHIGTQTINVTYEGITKSFPVTITDGITSIKMHTYPKQQYKYGERLDVTNGTIEVVRNSSSQPDIVDITLSMVQGFDPNVLGTQTLTVNYEGLTTTYEVEVVDYIARLDITRPRKTVYNIGERTMDLTGGKVAIVMASGKVETPVNMTIDMIQGFDTSSSGTKTITVTYQGMQGTFTITVVDELSDVKIKELPNKVEYLYGEELDLTGGTLEVTKSSGSKQTIPMDRATVTGYDPKKIGEQKIKVTYEGFTDEFTVVVKDYVTRMTITPPRKLKYEYGESLNLEGGSVTIFTASGSIQEIVPMTASMVSGYNSTKEGLQDIAVTYKDLQGSFQVTVIDEIKGIEMNTNPNKTSYKYGQKLDVTGATIKVTKSSGTYIVTVTDDMVSGYNSKKAGTQSITVTYAGFETNFAVKVAKKATTTTKPSTPSVQQPETNKPTVVEPEIQEPEVQEPEVQKPQVQKPQKPEVQEPEKPTEVLGVQDEDNGDIIKLVAGIVAGAMGIIGLLILLIVIFKRNVEVYVVEDGEFVLGGKANITKRDPSLNIDKFLDRDTYAEAVKVVLSDRISEKLDGKAIEITHRGKTIKHTVKYSGEEYEFILD